MYVGQSEENVREGESASICIYFGSMKRNKTSYQYLIELDHLHHASFFLMSWIPWLQAEAGWAILVELWTGNAAVD